MNAAATPPGFLITVEGIDGAGQSTQVERLAALLTARGHRLVGTREPGATALGGNTSQELCSALGFLGLQTGEMKRAPLQEIWSAAVAGWRSVMK